MDCLREAIVGTEFYHPKERGIEKRVAERMEEIRRLRESARTSRDDTHALD
jgi:replication-associated recombination protein RarA